MPNRHQYGFRWAWSYNGNTMPAAEVWPVASGQNDVDDAAAAININVGDPVARVNTGGVIVATTGVDPYGIVVGINQYWDGTNLRKGKFLPHATLWTSEALRSEVLVIPVRAGYWECDCDDGVTATTPATYRALRHSNVTHVCPGNTVQANANPMLDISTTNVTNTLEWRIVDVSRTMENQDFATLTTVGTPAITSAFVKLIVRSNVSTEAGEVASGGAVAGL